MAANLRPEPFAASAQQKTNAQKSGLGCGLLISYFLFHITLPFAIGCTCLCYEPGVRAAQRTRQRLKQVTRTRAVLAVLQELPLTQRPDPF